MSQKIIIGAAVAVVAVAGVAVGLPMYTSGQIQSQFEAAFAPPAAECLATGFVNKLESFDKGLFSSTAVTTHTLKGLESLGMPPLRIEHKISNMPGFSGMGHVSSRIVLPKGTSDAIPVDFPALETNLHGDGSYDGSWAPADINALALGKTQEKLTMTGTRFTFSRNAGSDLKLGFDLGNLQVDSAMGKFAMAGINFVNQQKGSMLCITNLGSEGSGKIGSVLVDGGGMGKAEIKNLTYKGSATDQNDDLTLKASFGMEHADAAMFGQSMGSVSNVVFDIDVEKLSRSAYFALAKTMQDIDPSKFEGSEAMDKIAIAYAGLLKNSPSAGFPKIGFTIDSPVAKGTFLANSKVTFDANGLDLSKFEPQEWMKRVALDSELQASKGLVQSLLAKMIQNRSDANALRSIGVDVPDVDAGEELTADAEAVKHVLSSLIAKGFLVEDGENHKIKITIEKAQILVNGKPQPGLGGLGGSDSSMDAGAGHMHDSESDAEDD